MWYNIFALIAQPFSFKRCWNSENWKVVVVNFWLHKEEPPSLLCVDVFTHRMWAEWPDTKGPVEDSHNPVGAPPSVYMCVHLKQ